MSQENIPNDRILRLVARLVAQIERADEIGNAGRRDAVRGPLMGELTTLVADYPEALGAVAEWVSLAMLQELGRDAGRALRALEGKEE